MFKPIILILFFFAGKAFALTQPYTGPIELGRPATKSEIDAYPITQFPDGQNLPKGKGGYKEGEALYAQHCASCHGKHMEGKVAFGAPRLIGGRGSLIGDSKPIKTIESFWPNPVSLYDYISRAMPFLTPKILTANEVYALCAYIFAKAHIIPKTEVLDEAKLPKVEMPNKNGFIDPYVKQEASI